MFTDRILKPAAAAIVANTSTVIALLRVTITDVDAGDVAAVIVPAYNVTRIWPTIAGPVMTVSCATNSVYPVEPDGIDTVPVVTRVAPVDNVNDATLAAPVPFVALPVAIM